MPFETRFTTLIAVGSLAVAGLAAAPGTTPTAGCTGQVIEHGTVASKAADPIDVPFTSFRPEVVPGGAELPVILHSHGWAGSRSQAGFEAWTDACMIVVSFDQRGFGEAGGLANVQDPDLEGQDVISLIDAIAAWPGVLLDAPGDPVLGAIGASYGGGYQWMTALTEMRDTGATRFNALAPEISWYDLPESLAPNDVPRSAWLTALYGAGAGDVPQWIHEGYAWGSSTGQWPNGQLLGNGVPGPDLDTVFHAHSPAAFADPDPDVRLTDERLQLDIPTLIRQGASDNLFNLNQGIKNFELTLTDAARATSTFVAYNGGHNLPNVAPLGGPVAQAPLTSADACTDDAGGWDAVRITFYGGAFGLTDQDTADLYGKATNVVGTTVDGVCIGVEGLGRAGDHLTKDAAPEDRVAGYGTTIFPTPLTVGAGAPANLPFTAREAAVAFDETVTVFGTPKLLLSTWPEGPDQRLFYAVSKGITPADATVIQNNVMPMRWELPVPGSLEGVRDLIELPAIVAQLAPGESLFLTVSPVSDMFFGHGSTRTPGVIVVHIMDVFLPHATVVG